MAGEEKGPAAMAVKAEDVDSEPKSEENIAIKKVVRTRPQWVQ